MFGPRHYVPILKAKLGEFSALEQLAASRKAMLTPLIEIPSVGWDFVKNQPRKGVGDHVKRIGAQLEKAWGAGRPLFLDSLLPADAPSVGGYVNVLNDARKRGVGVVPVTRLDRDADYQAAARAALKADKLGVCIRLSDGEASADPVTLDERLQSCLAAVGGKDDEADVVIDFGEIAATQGATLALAAQAIINSFPRLKRWRSITVAASAFPASLAKFKTGTIGTIERADWTMWNQLRTVRKPARMVTFSDYAIQHPAPFDMDPRMMKPSASIRYTSQEKWVIVKGPDFKKAGPTIFRTQSKKLMAREEYCGPGHCAGDSFIAKCAAGEVSGGNLTTWRRVGTSHHLELVAEQIASLSGL